MLKMRLQRIGRKNDPHFRAVVVDAKFGPKSGKFIDTIGTYNPKSGELTLKEERIKYWLSVGAQPSDTFHNFLVSKKLLKSKKKNVLSKKNPIKKKAKKA